MPQGCHMVLLAVNGLTLLCYCYKHAIMYKHANQDQGRRNVIKSGGAIIIYMIESLCKAQTACIAY